MHLADTRTQPARVDPGMTLPVVCATGHRIQYFNGRPKLASWVQHHLGRAAVWLRDECGTTTAITGMAVGTDMWWADAAHRAGLTLGAHIPCPQQNSRWPAQSRREWERLYALRNPELDFVAAGSYSVQALFKRNNSMLRTADAVIAVWDPRNRNGGTFDALLQANRMGLPGIWLNPQELKITRQLPTRKELGLE